jgi:hypothetical protein
MAPRLQQIFGLIFCLLGIGAAIAAWRSPLLADPIVRRVVAAFAALALIGLAMMILPSPREERERRGDDLWELSGLRMLTARWWLVILLTIALGGAHYAVVSHEAGMPLFSAQAKE